MIVACGYCDGEAGAAGSKLNNKLTESVKISTDEPCMLVPIKLHSEPTLAM